MRWEIPAELSAAEQKLVKRMRRASRFFVFLRKVRHELFDDAFQDELAQVYKPRGQKPVPPAMLAMVTLLQAYKGVSDRDAVDAAEMDLRWQLVLGTIGESDAPFGQGSLVRFRERLITGDLDRKLVDRTVELARSSGDFGWQRLRAALDSSPLLGAGRVLDTWNLLGRTMHKVLDAVAAVSDVSATDVIEAADLHLLRGPSLKASLDIDWDDPEQRHEALQQVLAHAEALQAWVVEHAAADSRDEPPLSTALELLDKVIEQDIEPDPDGGSRIRRGTSRDRMPSIGDAQMRHGRKSRSNKFTGYKRHVVRVLDTRLIAGAVVLPANAPEHDAVDDLLADVRRHGELQEVAFDRAYLGSAKVPGLLDAGITVTCKPWSAHNRGRFTKADFKIAYNDRAITCPAGESATFRVSDKTGRGVARFGQQACENCALRQQCTTSRRGRTVSLHRLEPLLIEMRDKKASNDGREHLRQRVAVEHSLARVGQLQGRRARYKGTRKNTFDLRRIAAVSNLMELARDHAA